LNENSIQIENSKNSSPRLFSVLKRQEPRSLRKRKTEAPVEEAKALQATALFCMFKQLGICHLQDTIHPSGRG